MAACTTSDRVSVVILATYNMGRYLPQAVQSVLEQSYPNVEVQYRRRRVERRHSLRSCNSGAGMTHGYACIDRQTLDKRGPRMKGSQRR